ncbi:Vibriobactin-specific isochorismatase [Rubripirellula obstinata]|uniref:Vibriobactin-specific isochorismatase n=1 Tax=Rubripirellula obstinata TaxID=406547 RepID=A0A5B1CSV2_9BACT|nr:isochorismatase family protein [Rubripirellula obstinata]KAA1262493.1 Vibriobactin-specific isochorismatase [Rubripirellula obstinata]
MPHVASVHRLDSNRSGLLVVDLQERLVPVIPSGDQVVRQTQRLLKAADMLQVPSAATVQYPKGLGNLVAPLDQWFSHDKNSPEEKLEFSSAVCRQSLDAWTQAGRDQIVVTGIETHVCILQTVLDLMAEGCFAYVVAEAVAARHGRDHETAMDRMRDAGATIITAESVMFEWLGTADHPQFKEISKLVKAGV